jgi:hypothetical protein
MLRFSLKEAVYKSIYPELGRYVAYKEIEILPLSNGTAVVTSRLQHPAMSFSSIAQWVLFTPEEEPGRDVLSTNNCFDEHLEDEDSHTVDCTAQREKRKFWVSCVHSYNFSALA